MGNDTEGSSRGLIGSSDAVLPGLSYLGVFDDRTINSFSIGMTEASSTEYWTRRLPQMDSALPRSPTVHDIIRVPFNSLYITVTVIICLRVHIPGVS
jgi:hypothetical protein